MNFAYLTEYSKLGIDLPRSEEFAYTHLTCSAGSVYRVEEDVTPLSPLYAIRFCNVNTSKNLLAVANEDGTVRLHDTRKEQTANRIDTFQAHYNAILDIVWLENDVKLVTSSGDHSAVLWDLGHGEATPVVRMVGHQGSVKTVACKPGDPNVFTTGARDGAIMQWDIRSNCCRSNVSHEENFKSVKPDEIIRFAHLKSALTGFRSSKNVEKALENSQCISSVVYQDHTAIISCSSTDKCIKVWDTRKMYSAFKGIPTPMYSINRECGTSNRAGYTSLAISPCRLKLYAYCTDAKIYCFNVGTYSSDPVKIFKSPGSSSFFCKINLSPDGKFVSSGSSDGRGYIWSVANPEMYLVALEGHSAEVTCVDWCKYGQLKLASCSDDGTYRIWKLRKENGKSENCCGESKPFIPSEPFSKRRFTSKYFATHLENRSSKRLLHESRKSNPLKILNLTPKKLERAISELPNFVIDGKSPHNLSFKSSQLSPATDGDWLRRLIAATPPPTSKTSVSSNSSNKKRKTPNRKTKPSARGSLLKYFKKTGEDSS